MELATYYHETAQSTTSIVRHPKEDVVVATRLDLVLDIYIYIYINIIYICVCEVNENDTLVVY